MRTRVKPGQPIDVPGYPDATGYRTQCGRPLAVLVWGYARYGTKPVDLIVCPWCRSVAHKAERCEWVRHVFGDGQGGVGKKALPSCGCRKGFGKNPNCSNKKKK